jgi:hypothetical protein
MRLALLAALLLPVVASASNATGKTLVRSQQGTLVPITGYSGPLIPDDPGTVVHVTWNGSALADSKGNTWTMGGTVPQVAKSGKVPAGAGVFSDSNYYSLGSGNDVLDFAGDFSLCIVFGLAAGSSLDVMLADITASTGYYIAANGSNVAQFKQGVNSYVTVNTLSTTDINVVCVGRAGSALVLKANNGAAVPGASTGTPATATIAYLGRFSSTGNAAAREKIYEVWASTSTATDYLFTMIQSRIKTRLGISAW